MQKACGHARVQESEKGGMTYEDRKTAVELLEDLVAEYRIATGKPGYEVMVGESLEQRISVFDLLGWMRTHPVVRSICPHLSDTDALATLQGGGGPYVCSHCGASYGVNSDVCPDSLYSATGTPTAL
jgi:hypothetical protein